MSDRPAQSPSSDAPSRLRDLPRSQGAMLAPSDYGIWNRRDRPFVVSIVGWTCAGIGYVSFFLKGGQLPMYFMDMKWLNPDWKPMHLSPGQFTASVAILLGEMVVALLAIAGGLGSLKVREWGRRVLIAYALAALVMGLFKATYQYNTFDAQIDFRISTTTESVNRDEMANREFFYLVTTTLMGLIWPVLIVTVMTRPHVRRAFQRRARLAGAGDAATLTNGDATAHAEPTEEDDWRSR